MAAPAYNPLAQLLADGTFSGLTVTCAGGSTFRLHRAILGAHSEYFSKACSGPFLEASSRIVDLPDVDPEVFKKLVDFAYTGTYTDFFVPNPEGLVVKAQLPSGGCKSTVARGRSLEPQEPLRSQPEAIDPPMIPSVSPEVVAEQLRNLAGLMGSSVQARQGKRKADNDKGETDEIDRSGTPSPHLISDELASWGHHHRQHIHHSFDAGCRSQQVEATLLASAKVYIIADRFMAPSLKVLSLLRFSAAVAHITSRLVRGNENMSFPIAVIYDAQKLYEMVELVYANTATTDVALKEPLCRLLIILGVISPDILRAGVYRLARNNSELGANLLAYTDLAGTAKFSTHSREICPECHQQTSHSYGPLYGPRTYESGYSIWECDKCYRLSLTHPLLGFSKLRSFQWMRQERDAAIAAEAEEGSQKHFSSLR